ncbi:MAG: hypothetical protein U9N34_11525 [Candidatus Cloacimonadota bacterium]|nr:hypothetical protein [Candidatus Cloacimonadota bacterium]
MEIKIQDKEIDILLDSLALLKATIDRRKRIYEPIDLDEIDDLISKIIVSNNRK